MKFKAAVTAAAIITLLSGTALASPTLSRNCRGDDVLTLQKKLYLIGYDITELDGVYGKETEKAVSAFQRDNKISVTGIVTNVTWRALKKAKEKKGRSLSALKVVKPPEPSANNPANNSATTAPYGKTFISAGQGNAIVSTAHKYLGVQYVFGGTTPSGFDCSGLVQYVFKVHGVSIPRLADEQYKLGKAVNRNQLVAGDLVFFTTYEAGVSHCGIYIGDGKFLHASSHGVRIDSLDNEYWKPRFIGAKKVVSN